MTACSLLHFADLHNSYSQQMQHSPQLYSGILADESGRKVSDTSYFALLCFIFVSQFTVDQH